MRDVAARAGVSRQLVSLVLREALGPSAASREAVPRSASELGFRPNTAARLLRQDRTGLADPAAGDRAPPGRVAGGAR